MGDRFGSKGRNDHWIVVFTDDEISWFIFSDNGALRKTLSKPCIGLLLIREGVFASIFDLPQIEPGPDAVNETWHVIVVINSTKKMPIRVRYAHLF